MRRIALINQKGGVGKTTITTNLGHALALAGHRVTVIDLDPQGQLASNFGLFRAPQKGIDRVLLNELELSSVRQGVRDLLTLIPAGSRLQEVEYLQDGGSSRAHLLRQALESLSLDQDFVLFDCPPSAGLLVMNAIFAADEALIPVSGLGLWMVLNRFFPRRKLCQEVEGKLRHHFAQQLLEIPIKESAVIAECPGVGRTIFEYRPSSHSAKEFRQLAEEILSRKPNGLV
ncbi:MAG: ParA family protein [Candidatus Thiodiazotropha sp.]